MSAPWYDEETDSYLTDDTFIGPRPRRPWGHSTVELLGPLADDPLPCEIARGVLLAQAGWSEAERLRRTGLACHDDGTPNETATYSKIGRRSENRLRIR